MHKLKKQHKPDPVPFLEKKAAYFTNLSVRKKKRWYLRHYPKFRLRLSIRKKIRFLTGLKIPFKSLDFVRWVMVDFLRGKGGKHWGIFCYVANPGEGKTLSMVAHMERAIKDVGRENLYIATNFHYARQDAAVDHWSDMIQAARIAVDHGKYCIIAMDEIHVVFDASDWKAFPPEMLTMLSFNRKDNLQFLCSSQRFERIPKKVVSISNYVVLCKNTLGLDRHFKNYYFNTNDYEAQFSGSRKKANFIRTYVASDALYALYDTRKHIDNMILDAKAEQDKRQQAFDLLFKKSGDEGAG